MRILSHGLPFFCAYDTLKAYRGIHEVRTLSAQPLADFRFRPEVDTLDDVLRRIAPEFVPDLILVWTPENDPPPLGIECSPVPTVCLAGDWNIFSPAQEVNFGRYDVVLADRPGTRHLANAHCRPVYWGPLYAHNPLLHRPAPGVDKDIDVLYLGSLNLGHRGARQRWLQRVADLPDDLCVVLATGAWGDAYTRALSRARIVFNHSIRGELNLRVFETLACGSLPFLESDNEEVRDFFTDGVDIVLYDHRNFEDKVRHYLAHWDEAKAVIARGQQKVKGFAGVERLDALVDFALAQPRSGRPFLRLDPRERALQDHLMITVSQRQEYGPLDQRLGAALAAAYPEEPRALSAQARSTMYYRALPPAPEALRACVELHRRAAGLDPASIVHAMNGASAARAIGNTRSEELFLQVALRAASMEPSACLWGTWTDVFWMKWLRARAEGKTTLAMVHAEARARLSALALNQDRLGDALIHARQATELHPADEDYARALAELLWAEGADDDRQRTEALGIMSGLLPAFPLDAAFRVKLAEMCIERGFPAQAAQLLDEVERIALRMRVPFEPKPGPTSHATAREAAAAPVAAMQEARLRARARDTGVYAPLMWFLGVQGRAGDLRGLAGALSPGEAGDQALFALLTEPETGAARGLALLEGVVDGPLHHALVKKCLAQGDTAGAWAVAEACAAAIPLDTACWNLLARFLSRAGDPRATEAVERSLAIAPRQEDIAALPEAPFSGELYLGTAPRDVPATFYLPAYNVARYIGDTLEHVLLQDYPLAELFVVNDGSSDESAAIARAAGVAILHHPHNLGLAAARNTALAEARGEWVVSVDTDARPGPDYVRRVVLEAENRDAATAAIGGMLIEDFQEAAPDKWRARVMAQHHGPVRQCPPWFLYGSTMCIERAAALAAGGYDEKHRTNGEDTELGKALAAAGKRLCYVPQICARHQRQDTLLGALRTWWNWHFWVKEEAKGWHSAGQLVHGMLHGLTGAAQALQRFIDAGERDLWYIGFLLVVHDPLCDLAHAAKTGLLFPGEARALTEHLLGRVAALDERFGGELLSWVRRDLAPVLTGLEAAASEAVLPGLGREMARYFAVLDPLLESFTAEFYRGIELAANAGHGGG